MSLSALSDRSAVLAAIAEFDALGRAAFLTKYGFGGAKRYFLLHNGERYDSKAIAGVAYGKQFPTAGPLLSSAFTGGEATVQAKLEALGFTVAVVGRAERPVPGLRPVLDVPAWAEVTSLEHGHGGPGWALGSWLWSPTTSKDGADRYGIMQQPAPGDQVFHLVAGVVSTTPRRRFLYGVSRVAAHAAATRERPPAAGAWADAEAYYRIELSDFRELALKPPMDDVEAELSDIILADLAQRPKYYPYAPYRDGFRGAQGIYLTRLTPILAAALGDLAGVGAQAAPGDASILARRTAFEFAEGERARRESSFFKRNPALRAAAVQRHGARCAACKLSFGETYGPLGEGYIEIHHLSPLAERLDGLRAETALTTLDDVAPLCANCHRIVHRRRPALSLDELRLALATAKSRGGRGGPAVSR